MRGPAAVCQQSQQQFSALTVVAVSLSASGVCASDVVVAVVHPPHPSLSPLFCSQTSNGGYTLSYVYARDQHGSDRR
jgi:hypothetical protein